MKSNHTALECTFTRFLVWSELLEIMGVQTNLNGNDNGNENIAKEKVV